LHRK